MMSQRASMTAIASINSASAAPSAPGSPGAALMLAATAQTPSSARAQTLSVRTLAPEGEAKPEICIKTAPRLLRTVDRLRRAETAAQLGAQLLGDAHRVDAVADDLRPDEDDQLGALDPLGVAADQLAEFTELIHQRNVGAVGAGALADQAGKQHGLPGRHSDRAFHLALRHRRRQRAGIGRRRHVADLLLDIE